jgi:RNA polymerase sigma-70 factor (ECF subfamily)
MAATCGSSKVTVHETRGDMDDVEEFDAFYHATSQRLFRQMYAMTGNRADAEECTQEAYARAWQRWKQVREAQSPEAWLRTVAWRIAASRWRKAKSSVAALTRLGAPEPAPPPGEDHVAVVTALRRLPAKQRQAIVLHHLSGLSVEEVAAEVGAPTGTVKARLSRGRAALAGLLGDDVTLQGGER